MNDTIGTELLSRIDGYLDAVPRAVARAERVGPFTLFINDGPGWRFYARPTPGARGFSARDVTAVRTRQRALHQPEVLEWLVPIAPGVADASAAAGMRTRTHPLMSLALTSTAWIAPPGEAEVRTVGPDEDLAHYAAVAEVGFGVPGTGAGLRDDRAYDAAVASADDAAMATARDRIRDGFTTMVAASIDGRPVAVGSYQPLDGVAEITGVATLPGFRRRGLAAAVTSALARHALDRGAGTIFLSADDEVVARVYARIGFRIVGAAGEASVPS